MKKGINKGFSLVELIVVVLIMAIIAVVLAPQVTKWVQNSRESSDLQTFDSVQEFAQLALTDSNANQESAGGILITITESQCKIEGQNGQKVDNFATKFSEYAGVSSSSNDGGKTYVTTAIHKKAEGEDMTIELNNGAIKTATSGITNADLETTSSSSPITTPGGSDPHTPDPTIKSVSISDIFVQEGGTTNITATLTGYSSDPELKWEIDDTTVATISGTGKEATITAVGQNGKTAKITVKVVGEESVTSTCTVSVGEASKYEIISIRADKTTLTVGETTTVVAEVTPTSAKVVWGVAEADQGKVSVSSEGVVTALAAGTVSIYGKVGGVSNGDQKVINITIVEPEINQIIVTHKFKEGPNSTVILVETVEKSGGSFSYTTFGNLKTNSSIPSDATKNEYEIVWEKKGNPNDSKVEFSGEMVVCKNEGSAYKPGSKSPKSIKLNGKDHPVFTTTTDALNSNNDLCYFCNDYAGGGAYIDSVVSEGAYTYHVLIEIKAVLGNGGRWSWTTTGNTVNVYIKK